MFIGRARSKQDSEICILNDFDHGQSIAPQLDADSLHGHFQRIRPVVGRLAYWGLRLGYPWNTRLIPWLLARMGREFPMLTNHFFVLKPSLQAPADRQDASLHGARIEEEMFENAR